MSSAARDKIVEDYLKRLGAASRGLPRAERLELRTQIEEHLRLALAAQPGEANAAAVVERLGDPDEIVAEQYGRSWVPQRLGARTWSAVGLLLFGGFLAGAGWLVGVVLLWSSRAWTTREKLIGTLLVPGGLAGAMVLAVLPAAGERCTSSGTAVAHCTGVTSTVARVFVIALFLFLLVAPVLTAIFLARRARPLED